jgi:hypothetical protein
MNDAFDYDLNIFQSEREFVDEDGNSQWEYAGPWYIDIYDVQGNGHEHVAGPYELTQQEEKLLALGTGYFEDPDSWYGLQGFVNDYADYLTPRLEGIFDSLPKHRAEVLF